MSRARRPRRASVNAALPQGRAIFIEWQRGGEFFERRRKNLQANIPSALSRAASCRPAESEAGGFISLPQFAEEKEKKKKKGSGCGI